MVIDDGVGLTAATSPALGGSAISGAPVPADPLVRYQTIRGNIEHEDQLMGTRVGWLIASEAFLFVAYANVDRADAMGDKAEQLRWVLPRFGGVIAVLLLGAIVAAMWAIHELKRQAHAPGCQVCQPLPLGLPPLVGKRATYWLGVGTTLGIPLALLGAWLYILWA